MRVITLFLTSVFLVLVLFGSLALAEQEYTAFDLYIGDELKGLIPVFYEDDSCKIENPVDVLRVAGLDPNNAELLELLKGEIKQKREIDGVGKVFINPRVFRIVLLPDSKYLSIKDKSDFSTLTSTADPLSYRTDLQYFLFDTDENKQISQYRVLNNISLGKGWINSDLDFIDDERYDNNINDLSANYISGRWQSSAGYLQSTGRQLTPSTNFIGATFRTEPLLFAQSEGLRGSVFQLYVPTRSRVEFYRNGVLIDTQVLSSGYQEVDTSRFPQGSYYVDINIKGLAGTSRERKFFAKSGFLTTRGAPQFRLDLGQLRINNEIIDTPYYQGSGEFRITDNIQVNLSSFGTDDKQTFVSGFNAVFGNFLITGAVSEPTKGSMGYAIGGGGSLYGFNLSGDYEKSEQVSIDELERIEFEQDRDSVEKPFLEERLGSKGERYTATLSKWFDNLELRYNYSYIFAEPDPTIDQESNYESYGPTVRYRINEDAEDSVYFELSSLKTDGESNLYALLTWQHRFAPWSTDTSVGLRDREGEKEPVARGILQYDTIVQRTGTGIRARAEELFQTQNDENQQSGSYDVRMGSNYGGLLAFGNRTEDNSSWAVSGNVSMAKGSGSFATGPTGLGQSLLIVDLKNEDQEAITDIVIDGQTISKIKGSGRYLLGISPYQKFNIRIKPSDTSPLTRYDTKTRKIILYPGSVQTEVFKIEKVFLAIGKIVDKDGSPLEYKRISGLKDYPLTEQEGYFQAEVVGDENLEIQLSEDSKCIIKLPVVQNKQYYHDFGTLVCR